MGPRDDAPDNALRRAVGIQTPFTPSIRSRFGSTLVQTVAGTAHSLFRFDGVRFVGAGRNLYRGAAIIKPTMSGNRLAFTPMPPQVNLADYLFITDGTLPIKVSPAGAITNWGIAAPPNGFTATASPASTKVIDALDSQATWTATDCALADDATIKQSGTNAIKMTVAASASGSMLKAIATDLTTFGGGVSSSDADYIAVWVRIDHPDRVDALQLEFSLTDATFASNVYSRVITVGNPVLNVQGLATVVPESTVVANGVQSAPSVLDSLAVTFFTPSENVWTRLLIPKATFARSGTSAATWANVAAVRLSARARSIGTINVWWDALDLNGGTGLQGRYRYHVTFANSTTGSRSNGNPTAVEVAQVNRQAVALANLPKSTDPQVNTREIWRTVGTGTLFFLIDTIPDNTTLTYTDRIPDAAALDTSASKIMQNVELPSDSAPPEATCRRCWGPFDGAMWLCSNTVAGTRGRVYFSAVGRPEAIAGFLDVTSDDDQTQTGVVWNSANYVFTLGRIFAIEGTNGIYTYREIKGCPGTDAPDTVQATPFGILYQSANAPRLFDGTTSAVVGQTSIADLFDGQSLEGVPAFHGVVATSDQNAYIISDLINTLEITLPDGAWRVVGLPAQALYFEEQTGETTVGLVNKTLSLEFSPTTLLDDASPIDFEVETSGKLVDIAETGIVQRIYIDLVTNGQALTPSLILDDGTLVVLPQLVAASRRTVELPYGKKARILGIRLTGTLSDLVEIFGIEADVYVPITPSIENLFAARSVATEERNAAL